MKNSLRVLGSKGILNLLALAAALLASSFLLFISSALVAQAQTYPQCKAPYAMGGINPNNTCPSGYTLTFTGTDGSGAPVNQGVSSDVTWKCTEVGQTDQCFENACQQPWGTCLVAGVTDPSCGSVTGAYGVACVSPYCGDGVCDSGETSGSCPADCSVPSCGATYNTCNPSSVGGSNGTSISNGSTWTCANSNGSSSCNSCNSGYSWNGSSCVAGCVGNVGVSCSNGNACVVGETIQCNGSCGGGSANNSCGVCGNAACASGPTINVVPATFTFNTPAGSNPASQILTIQNTDGNSGDGNLNWSVTTNAPSMLTVSRSGPNPTSGSEVPGGQSSPALTVQVSSSGLAVGTYSANIIVSSNDSVNPSVTIPVQVNVANNDYCTNLTPGINQMQGCVWNDNISSDYLGGTGNGGSGAGIPGEENGNAPAGNVATGNADNFVAFPTLNSGPQLHWLFGGPNGLTFQFSIRWQGTFNFSGGTYLFSAGADDGDALYVDGVQKVFDWGGGPYRVSSASVNLTTGPHTIQYEYYQAYGDDDASLSWSQTAALPLPYVNIDYPAISSSTPDYFHTWPNDGNGDPEVYGAAVNIAGWALDAISAPIASVTSVTILVDGSQVGGNFAHTWSRPDVCTTYPGRADCNNVGFTYNWNSTSVSNGTHTITVKATDPDGQTYTASKTIMVSNCTVYPYNGGGFSAYSTNTGPSGTTLTISPGAHFYAYVDYGAGGLPANANNPITPPTSGSFSCSWGPGTNSGWVAGSSGNSMARFDCVSNNPSSAGNYTYQTGINTIYDYDNIGRLDLNDEIYLHNVQTNIPGYTCPVGKDCDVYNDGSNDAVSLNDYLNYRNMVNSATTACVASGQNIGTLTVSNPAPGIFLSPSTLTFNGVSGGSTPGAQAANIFNTGAPGSTLVWHATTDQSWCFVGGTGNGTYYSGSNVAYNASSGFSVSVGAPSSVGSFTCHVIVSDNGSSPSATNTPQQLTVTYNVTAPAPTVTLTATPASIVANSTSTLTWTISNATSCANTSGNMPAGNWSSGTTNNVGASTAALASNTTYTITCTGPGGSLAASATVTVTIGDPTSPTATGSGTTCNSGQSVLSWTAGGGATHYNVFRNTSNTTVGATQIATNLAATGMTDTAVSGTTYYYWVQSVGGGGTKVPFNTNGSGGITPRLCPTLTLTATPSTVTTNGTTVLAWTVANATSCASSGATAMPAGNWTTATNGSTTSAAIPASTNFGLLCSDSFSPPDSIGVIRPVIVTSCVGQTGTVSVPSPIEVGSSTTASYSAGWSNVTYTSSAPGVANITSQNGTIANLTGVSGSVSSGVTTISGIGKAPNGNTGCALTTNGTLSVTDYAIVADVPSPASIPAGSNSTFLVHVNPVNGNISGLVAVSPPSLAGLTGWSWAQGTQSASVGGTVSFTLNTTAGAIQQNNYPLTFTGTYNSVSRTSVTNITVTSPPVCPAGSVVLSSGSVNDGSTVTASPSSGNFTGGTFAAANGDASVSGNTVTGQAVGSVNISGNADWNNSNGATGCSLNPSTLTVTAAPPGGGNPNNITVTAGSGAQCETVTINWTAGSGATSYNVYRNTSNSTTTATKITNVAALTDTDSVAGTGPFYYWVESAVGGVGTGTWVAANTNSSGGVNANLCGVTPGNPGNPQSYNALGSTSCDTVLLQWNDNSNNEDGFYIYRTAFSASTTANGGPVSGSYIATVPSTTKVGTGSQYSYTYATPDNNPYYYWVTAYTNTPVFAESSAAGFAFNGGGSISSVASFTCLANMLNSDKVVTAINGVNVSPAPGTCNQSGASALPSGTLLNLGDRLDFRIDLCNSNGGAAATGIEVADTLVNLATSSSLTSFNAQVGGSPLTYDGACAGTSMPAASGHYCIYGSYPDQTLQFNLTGAAYDLPAGTGYEALTFSAILSVPGNFNGTNSRFYNKYQISNSGPSEQGQVGWPFYTGKPVPTINEIP